MRDQNNNFSEEKDKQVLEENLTMIGMFALSDTLREDVDKAVKRCVDSGITVRMVTGDNIITSSNTAIEAGIIT